MKILLIDNFDSFTYNLEHLLVRCGSDVFVINYSEIRGTDLAHYDAVVISPGPGKPDEYKDYEILKNYDKPVLGICLGMQVINELEGGKTEKLGGGVHGKTERLSWNGKYFDAARYHSLYCSEVSDCYNIEILNENSIPMMIRHKSKRWTGMQFHPESFMTESGAEFIKYAL